MIPPQLPRIGSVMTAAISLPCSVKMRSSAAVSFQPATISVPATAAGMPLEPGAGVGAAADPHSPGPGWPDQWIASDQPW